MAALTKHARAPACKPPLLEMWGQIDLADSIVAFMGMKTLAKVPTICRSLRAAQPLILFTAARRLKAVPDFTSACLRALHAATPREKYQFHESWGFSPIDNWKRAPHMDDYNVHSDIYAALLRSRDVVDYENAPRCCVLERRGEGNRGRLHRPGLTPT